jgi:hypothetical protein
MPEVDTRCKPSDDTRPPARLIDEAELADLVAAAVERADAGATEEQAPHGPDALDETDLHPVLADELMHLGWSVERESTYPSDPGGNVLRRDRERCDLVVLGEGRSSLVDPVRERMEIDAGDGTLFAPNARAIVDDARPSDAGGPAEAAWVEVKLTGRTVYRDGVPTPNRAYADELVVGAVGDADKLARARGLGARFVVLVVFTDDASATSNDLATVTHRVLDHAIPARMPTIRIGSITDRAGNDAVVVGVIPVDERDDLLSDV